MGQITSLFVWKVLGEAEEGIDKADFLRSVGIDPDAPVDPSYMISDAAYYGFLERLAAAERNPVTIPLRVGGAMRCNDYSAFGLAWKSAVNLRGSIERAERYWRILTSVSIYAFEPTAEGGYMHLHREGDRRLGMRLSNEASMASIASISREVSTAPFHPIAVYFKHPAPDDTSYHEAYFGCPVHFDTNKDALLFSRASLVRPNKVGDPGISTFFDTRLEAELLKRADDNALDKQVCAKISRSLSEGVPMISDVAQHLGMSGRTLQRRLSGQGSSYKTLVDASRRQLAERLLQQTDYSLAEVAFMTGYSEQSAFNRAFKRWAGQTPRSYRLNVQAKPS
ncbi:MAG: AraC family transcriptional regulator [Rhodothermales bacterium]